MRMKQLLLANAPANFHQHRFSQFSKCFWQFFKYNWSILGLLTTGNVYFWSPPQPNTQMVTSLFSALQLVFFITSENVLMILFLCPFTQVDWFDVSVRWKISAPTISSASFSSSLPSGQFLFHIVEVCNICILICNYSHTICVFCFMLLR